MTPTIDMMLAVWAVAIVFLILVFGVTLVALAMFGAVRAVLRKLRTPPYPLPTLRDLQPGDHFITARDEKYKWAVSSVFEVIEGVRVRRVYDDFHMLIELDTPVIKVKV